jgi:hypothetical protein
LDHRFVVETLTLRANSVRLKLLALRATRVGGVRAYGRSSERRARSPIVLQLLATRRGRGSRLVRGRGQPLEPGERLSLELADTFACEAHFLADLVQRPWVAVEAEPQLEDPPLPLGKRLQQTPRLLSAQPLLERVARVGRRPVFEDGAELVLNVRAEALVERDGDGDRVEASATCRSGSPVASASSLRVGSRPCSAVSFRAAQLSL